MKVYFIEKAEEVKDERMFSLVGRLQPGKIGGHCTLGDCTRVRRPFYLPAYFMHFERGKRLTFKDFYFLKRQVEQGETSIFLLRWLEQSATVSQHFKFIVWTIILVWALWLCKVCQLRFCFYPLRFLRAGSRSHKSSSSFFVFPIRKFVFPTCISKIYSYHWSSTRVVLLFVYIFVLLFSEQELLTTHESPNPLLLMQIYEKVFDNP